MSFRVNLSRLALLPVAGAISLFVSSCSTSPAPSVPPQYIVTPIASDLTGIGTQDLNLKNPWGAAFDPTGLLVVALNHSSTATYYDTLGHRPGGSIPIPSPSSAAGGGAPTGLASSTAFTIPNKGQSAFVFVGEDGIVSAWGNAMGSSTPAVVVSDRHTTSIFKGAVVQGNFLYAADFKSGTIDVFDKNFVFKFSVPDNFQALGYAPFNIASIDGKLYVSSARPKKPDAQGSIDDSSGVGIGYVAIYNADGTSGLPSYSSTFASAGNLNSPWAIIKAPGSFGKYANDILVGNFGDGKINIFDGSGKSLGQLNNTSDAAITIPGLWALVAPISGNAGKIFYTAGTNDEADGTIGYIAVKQ